MQNLTSSKEVKRYSSRPLVSISEDPDINLQNLSMISWCLLSRTMTPKNLAWNMMMMMMTD